MNFGVKIGILYLSFVGMILTLVFMCYRQKVDLVSKDYYAQELKFQDKIDAINNEKKLTGSITHELNGKELILTADSLMDINGLEGTINFFRPSDSGKDVNLKMNFQNRRQSLNTSALLHGVYKMQLSWSVNRIHYFKEDVIFVN